MLSEIHRLLPEAWGEWLLNNIPLKHPVSHYKLIQQTWTIMWMCRKNVHGPARKETGYIHTALPVPEYSPETSSGSSCLQLPMKWCSQSSLGLWWDVNIFPQWQLVHRHSIPSQMEADLAAQAHGDLKSSPSPGTALPPQMTKEMFVTWQFPAPLLWGISTSGNTRNHKPNTE